MKRSIIPVLVILAGLFVLSRALAADKEPGPEKRSNYSGYGTAPLRKAGGDANSTNADLKSLPDPNSAKAKIKEFDGLEKALENINRGSEREMREWMRGPVEERMNLAKTVQDQAFAELAFIRELAAEEGALKTTAAIDGLLLDRQERFEGLFKKIEAGMRRMRRGERGYRRDRERRIGMREAGSWREGEQDMYPEGDAYRDNGVFRGRDTYRYRDRDRYRSRQERTTRRPLYERDEREQDDSTDY